MRYIATFFWVFILTNMAGYVVASMTGSAFDFQTATITSAVLSGIIFAAGDFGETKTEASTPSH